MGLWVRLGRRGEVYMAGWAEMRGLWGGLGGWGWVYRAIWRERGWVYGLDWDGEEGFIWWVGRR